MDLSHTRECSTVSEMLKTDILKYCGEYGLEITDHIASDLEEYLDLLLDYNKHTNLTAITDKDKGIILHLVDSLLFSVCLNRAQEHTSLIDIGTGGGLPGIPLAISNPSLQVTLLDSVKKKCDFHQIVIDKKDLTNVNTICSRAEDYARDNLNSFDYVTSRAVAQLPILIEYATPLLKPEGILIASKGRIAQEEKISGDAAAKICGLELVEIKEFELPNNYGHRELLLYQKVREADIKLPRRAGVALKRPLG